MVKADVTGESRIETNQVETVAKRQDYRAPTLSVVGTVDDLTLSINNVGNADTAAFRSGGGG